MDTETLAWRPLVEKLEELGYLDEYWESVDFDKYPQDHLLGPNGRALAMAVDLIN